MQPDHHIWVDYITVSLQMSVLFSCLCLSGGRCVGTLFSNTEFMRLFNNINPEKVQPNKPGKYVADVDSWF